MRLNDYFSKENIVTDCEFFALGLSNSKVGKHFLSFLDDRRYLDEINGNNEICGIITSKEILEKIELSPHVVGIITVENPRRAYFELHNSLSKDKDYITPMTETVIGSNCKISATAIIDEVGVVIGDNVTVGDYAVIGAPCIIGNNTHIHAGVKIGGSGFEFKRYSDCVLNVIHCGLVEIGNNVEIWENTTIHKAVYPWDKTLIGDWCRIGAQSHIDHGAKLYEFVELCARCVISGRVSLGKYAFIGPGTVISNRIQVGDEAKVLIGSVVTQDIPAKSVVSGNFAIEHEKHMERIKADSKMVLE